MPRLQMYVNSDVNVLSFEGNFVTLHLGTVLIVNVYCLLCIYKNTNQLLSYQLFPSVFRPAVQPFRRSVDNEGSRSVAERFVIVNRTKPSPAHIQRLVVTFPVANIVTDDPISNGNGITQNRPQDPRACFTPRGAGPDFYPEIKNRQEI